MSRWAHAAYDDDTAQHLLEYMWTRGREFENPKAYARLVARHHLIDKSRKRTEQLGVDIVATDWQTPDRVAEARERLAKVPRRVAVYVAGWRSERDKAYTNRWRRRVLPSS